VEVGSSAGDIPAYAGDEAAAYDPGAHTVAEVQDYVTANPGQAQTVRDAEAAGKNRSTLLTWLDGVIAG
jgi:hypothetical protein